MGLGWCDIEFSGHSRERISRYVFSGCALQQLVEPFACSAYVSPRRLHVRIDCLRETL